MLKMDLEYKDGILYARLGGVLNNKSSYKINNYLIPVIEKHKIKYLIYNLKNLSDINQEGTSAIVKTKIEMKKIQGKLFLTNLSESVALKLRNLKITKLKDEQDILERIEA